VSQVSESGGAGKWMSAYDVSVWGGLVLWLWEGLC
jgi:hypothetical protein